MSISLIVSCASGKRVDLPPRIQLSECIGRWDDAGSALPLEKKSRELVGPRGHRQGTDLVLRPRRTFESTFCKLDTNKLSSSRGLAAWRGRDDAMRPLCRFPFRRTWVGGQVVIRQWLWRRGYALLWRSQGLFGDKQVKPPYLLKALLGMNKAHFRIVNKLWKYVETLRYCGALVTWSMQSAKGRKITEESVNSRLPEVKLPWPVRGIRRHWETMLSLSSDNL